MWQRTLYPYVATNILEWSQPEAGVWVDLGAGAGDVGVASSENEAAARSTIILLDPNADALRRALRKGRKKGVETRLVAVVGVAERMPLPDNSVDLVFSRASIITLRYRICARASPAWKMYSSISRTTARRSRVDDALH